jgi:glycosyltransferase involved in cell wall biosynthesis
MSPGPAQPIDPLVSVILCTYNQGKFIEDAVNSVLQQTYRNFELIVIDNGSTDDTPSLLGKFAGDPRIRLLLFDGNAPVTRRLNEGLRLSSGEYFSLLYGDDYYVANKLERQVEAFRGLGAEFGVVYSPGYRLNVLSGEQWQDRTLRSSGWILDDLLLLGNKGFVNPISPLMRRACFNAYPFDETLFIEGESINFRYALSFKYFFLDEPLVVMREHEFNAGKAIKGNIESLMIVLDKLRATEGFPPRCQGTLAKFRSRVLRDSGWQGVRVANDPTWARQCLLQCVRTSPWQALHPRTVAALVLSLVPGAGRRIVNLIANSIRRSRGIVRFVDPASVQMR